MTKTTAALTLLFLVSAPAAQARDASACYAIQDADQRAYCLAQARHDPSTCYSIQRSDLRAQCRAEVRE